MGFDGSRACMGLIGEIRLVWSLLCMGNLGLWADRCGGFGVVGGALVNMMYV